LLRWRVDVRYSERANLGSGKLHIPEKDKLDAMGLSLLAAAQQGKYRLIATKVRLDEDVNVKEPDEGFTALMYAASYDDTAVIQALLRSPTLDLNAANRFGLTALMIALQANAIDAAQMLVQQGGTLLNIPALNNLTAFRIALKKNNERALEILLRERRYNSEPTDIHTSTSVQFRLCVACCARRLLPTPADYRKAVRIALREKYCGVLCELLRRRLCQISDEDRRSVRINLFSTFATHNGLET